MLNIANLCQSYVSFWGSKQIMRFWGALSAKSIGLPSGCDGELHLAFLREQYSARVSFLTGEW